MALADSILTRISDLGAVKGSAAPGNVAGLYYLSTNDNATAVETNGYLDGAVGNGLIKGDVIIAALDLDGTPALKHYLVTVGGADVTIVAMVDAT